VCLHGFAESVDGRWKAGDVCYLQSTATLQGHKDQPGQLFSVHVKHLQIQKLHFHSNLE